eukprot:GDKI01042295.1.p1 GENE.GDKI01042295.1~~GDKI01042295.1.p1  ORF type:complete len:165 (+),score=29.77 GDKI01042295.1:88-582(+)
MKSQRPKKQLTKKEMKKLQGHPRHYQLMGGRPEFHNIVRNSNGHIIEPTDKFLVIITSSKNNCHIIVQNKTRDYRTLFYSNAGNVGYRKTAQQTPQATYRIAQNIARKCKRLGITHADVRFRRLARVETCLQAFQAHSLNVTALIHEPKLPKGRLHKPRKRRRV